MSFAKQYKELIEQHKVEEKLDWKSLLAAGLIAAPGAAKEMPQKEQPAIVKNAVRPSSEEKFLYDIKHLIRQREGSNNFNNVKKLHGGTNDPTIGWGHSLRYTNQSRAIFNKILPNVDFDSIINKNKPAEISLLDAEKLLDYDVKERVKTLKRIYPNFFNYEYDTQQALFDLLYRGDLVGKVSDLLKAGEKEQAFQILRNNAEKSPAKIREAIKKRVEDSIQKLNKSKFFVKPKPAPKK